MSFKPANMPTLIPYLTVINADKSLKFYKEAFGFEVINEPAKDEKGNTVHCEMKFHDVVIMFAPEGVYGMTCKAPKTLGVEAPLNLYLYCKDVDSFYQNAVKNGAVSKSAPEDAFWGDRFCTLIDPNGYTWSFSTHKNK